MSAEESITTKPTAGERWVSFLRGYGPVNRIDGMYAETIRRMADAHQIEPLHFRTSRRSKLFTAAGSEGPGENRLPPTLY